MSHRRPLSSDAGYGVVRIGSALLEGSAFVIATSADFILLRTTPCEEAAENTAFDTKGWMAHTGAHVFCVCRAAPGEFLEGTLFRRSDGDQVDVALLYVAVERADERIHGLEVYTFADALFRLALDRWVEWRVAEVPSTATSHDLSNLPEE